MFQKRTLFVLGAGASREFGLPLGPALASTIAENMNVRFERGNVAETKGADILDQVWKNRAAEINEFLKAFSLIRHGVQLSSSIDDFLDVHASNEKAKRVGKMAIVKTVIKAERDSSLYFDKSNIYNRIPISNFENTWIVKFMRMLGRGLRVEDKEKIFRNVAFIVFNYDRCLEHFLVHALRQFYAIDENTAASILKTLTIIHPYGLAAPFKTHDGAQGYHYAAEGHGFVPDYWSLSDGIRTYSEQMTDASELQKIHQEINEAQRIVFLGFGFHDQNLGLLAPPGGMERKQIFATAKGMSDSDVSLVRAQLIRFFTPNAQMLVNSLPDMIQIRSDLTCTELFDSYNKSLPA
jgi:hypothetical protein